MFYTNSSASLDCITISEMQWNKQYSCYTVHENLTSQH